MRVWAETGSKLTNVFVIADKVVYTAVTVGCPTAYRLKYKEGGLAKMQPLPAIMPTLSSIGESAENRAYRIKTLLGKGLLKEPPKDTQ